jgi:toxin HigB-1
MIRTFSCADTEAFFGGLPVARFRNIASTAERKLQMLDCAATLAFLRSPPGNRLEALRGNRTGQHSIRINDQWRICFVWTSKGPEDVEIVDYH